MVESRPETHEPDDTHRILLVIGEGRDRDLLREYLASIPEYDVVTVASAEDVPDAYDLCLVHYAIFDRVRSVLDERRRDADPVYLPTLLFVPPSPVSFESALADDSLVTDVVQMPVDQSVLERRIRNLVETRQASMRLAEREDQYRQLVELMPDCILLVDGDDIVYANTATHRLLQNGPGGSLEQRSLSEFVAPKSETDVRRLLDTVAERGRTEGYTEITLTTDDGREKPTTSAGVRVVYEGRPVTQLVVHDISSRKAQEQRLSLYGRAIDAASQGITIADVRQDDDPLVYANAAFQRITGYSLDEILGRNCRFLQGEHTDSRVVEHLRRNIEARRAVSVELLNYRQDGTPFWNQLDVVPVSNEDGAVTHYLGLQRDVTSRKRNEQRISVLDRMLRHNLRNQMNVIVGNADLLSDGEDPAVVGERIRDAATNLLDLTEQVRSFRGVIMDEASDLKALDLVAMLTDAVDEFRTLNPNATVDLSVPESARIRGHPALSAAFTALLQLVGQADDPAVELRVTVESDSVCLYVTERSSVIASADLRILEADSETAIDHLQGVELWLVRWAVEGSGGELFVESAEPKARLKLRFRRAEPGP